MELKKYLIGALVSVVMALGATSASAVTFTGDDADIDGSGSVSFVDNGPTANIDFVWDDTAYNAFVTFTAFARFDLFFDAYSPEEENSNVSGIRLIGPGDVTISRTDQTCDNALAPLQGSCQLVTSSVNSGGLADLADKPDSMTPLFADLSGGTYTLAFFESVNPSAGSASFSVAAVPLPAGLVLLIGGLGVLGFAARRKA